MSNPTNKSSQSKVTSIDDAPVAAPAPAAAEAPVAVHGQGGDALSGQRRMVTIHPSDGDGGSDAVFISLNGYAFQIPRGTPQSIPVEVLEILKNAKSSIYHAGPGGALIERVTQRFAFSVE